jgi:hypothetical protein
MMNSMDNTDIDTYYPVMGDIDHEPLISNKAHQAVPFTMRYLDFLSFLTGSLMTAGSELLMSPMMQTYHPKNAWQMACFCWAWIVWTYLALYLGMTAWMRLVLRGRSVQDCDEALSFKLQAYYIVGSLTGLSLGIQIASFVTSAPPVAALLAVVAMMLWASLMLCMIRNTNYSYYSDGKDKGSINITSTYQYQLIGATIGLITGLSQIALLLYNWMNPRAGAMLLLLVWLGVTAAGWAAMHLIDQDDCEDKERTYRYITGICLAWICLYLFWIVVDLVYNKGENIPIFCLLSTLSLAGAFMAVALDPKKASLEERETFV